MCSRAQNTSEHQGSPEPPRTPFSRTSRNAASRHLGEVLSTAPHPPKPGHIAQTVNAREFSYSTCCSLQPLVACQFRGRGFGIESTADVLLTKASICTSWPSRFYGFCRQKRESTSGLEPLSCSLRVITQALQGCAGDCKRPIFRGVFFPCLAACCTVLRSRWYQSGINVICAPGFD